MRPHASQFCRFVCLGTSLLFLTLLTGCAAGGGQSSSSQPSLLDKMLGNLPEEEKAATGSVDQQDCGSPAQCRSALKKMVQNPKRGWVGQQQPPGHYVDGTRLFAYRALRAKLSCPELSAALGEVRAASKSLTGEVSGVSREQLSRTRALSQQVEGELARERGTRCKA